MPPLPTIRGCNTLLRLEVELRHAPRDALLRHLEHAEAVAREIDPFVEYPGDWLVFRITGFRPTTSAWAVHHGRGVLGALPAFCERVSARAALTHDELPSPMFVPSEALRSAWGVSVSTFLRLRRKGLVARRARGPTGRTMLYIPRANADVFERTFGALARVDEQPARLPVAQREAIVHGALRALAQRSVSLHQAAKELAEEHGRSVEGVRLVLRRDPRSAAAFPVSRPLADRRGRALLWLWRRGMDIAELAALAEKPSRAVRRSIDLARAEDLARWLAPLREHVSHGGRESSATTRAAESWPGPPAPWPRTLGELLAQWRVQTAMSLAREAGLVRALRASVRIALVACDGLDALHPRAGALDEAETALRSAAAFHAALVFLQGRVMLDALEARLGEPLPARKAPEALRALRLAIDAASEAVFRYDQEPGGRLAGAVALAVDKGAGQALRADAHAAHARPVPQIRAADMLIFAMELPMYAERLVPWKRALCADERRVAGGSTEHRAWIHARFGLGDRPPRTLASLREERGWTGPVARKFEQEALRAVRGAPRSASG